MQLLEYNLTQDTFARTIIGISRQYRIGANKAVKISQAVFLIKGYNPNTKHNKRALGPWVAHLIVMFIKGKGKQSFPLSPEMNFNRSAVSF